MKYKTNNLQVQRNLLIIDGSSLLVTNYYANLPFDIMKAKIPEDAEKAYSKILHTSDGKYTNALLGFMKTFLKILAEQKPSHIAVVFDKTRDTFRRQISSDYKANRKETPKPLKEQFIAVENLLEKSGIHIFLGDEYEADDYAGSLAEKFYKDIPVNVMTKDMDYLQLVSNEKNIRAWMMQTTDAKWQEMLEAYDVKEAYENMPNKVFVFSEDTITEEYGVEHGSQIVEYKALVGDKSDNIQGVNGIGEKVAIPLIREYGTIENLYADIEETGSEIEDFWASQLGMRKGAYKKLTAEGAKESAMQSKLLATIKKDIPLKISLDELRTTLNEEALISELRRYEMKSLCSEDDIAVYKEIAER